MSHCASRPLGKGIGSTSGRRMRLSLAARYAMRYPSDSGWLQRARLSFSAFGAWGLDTARPAAPRSVVNFTCNWHILEFELKCVLWRRLHRQLDQAFSNWRKLIDSEK